MVEKFEDHGYPFVERVKDNERDIIEVYPNQTIKALFGEIPKYKNVKKSEVWNGVRKIWGKLKETNFPIVVDLNDYRDYFSGKLDDLTARELKGWKIY